MYRINTTSRFKRSLRKLRRSGLFKPSVEVDLVDAIRTLAAGKNLPRSFRDHALEGTFIGLRECHIKGNLLFIYQKDTTAMLLDLVDIGSHSEIFG
jgi:mRNA interferase YafQ